MNRFVVVAYEKKQGCWQEQHRYTASTQNRAEHDAWEASRGGPGIDRRGSVFLGNTRIMDFFNGQRDQ